MFKYTKHELNTHFLVTTGIDGYPSWKLQQISLHVTKEDLKTLQGAWDSKEPNVQPNY